MKAYGRHRFPQYYMPEWERDSPVKSKKSERRKAKREIEQELYTFENDLNSEG